MKKDWENVGQNVSNEELKKKICARRDEIETYSQIVVENKCAQWIPKENRKILILSERMVGWEDYQNGTGYNGGESYWSSSLDYALRKSLGFEVYFRRMNGLGDEKSEFFQKLKNGTIHRVITDGDGGGAFPYAKNNPYMMCKFRHSRWWPMSESTEKQIDERLDFWDNPKDMRRGVKTLPYVADPQTATYFFVHSQLTLPPIMKKKEGPILDGERKAFVLCKNCWVQKEIITALVNANFELHFTCSGYGYKKQLLDSCPEEYHTKIIDHGHLTPTDYGMMLRNMSVVIGLGEPRDSPTPYEALANGATFLNAINRNNDGKAQASILQHLGEPYVINYNYTNDDVDKLAQNILEAAERAIKHSFTSFIPYEHRYESVVSQICSNLIEDDTLCEMLEVNE